MSFLVMNQLAAAEAQRSNVMTRRMSRSDIGKALPLDLTLGIGELPSAASPPVPLVLGTRWRTSADIMGVIEGE
jgi:hypothetical protein